MVNFPTPIGGTVLAVDFAPSVLFAVLYALLVPFTLYRMLHRRSRTILLLGTVSFSIERIVIFSLRAEQSHNDRKRFSKGLVTYMQVSFGMGFIGIASDLANLLSCLLINPTYGSETYFQSPAASTKGYVVKAPPEGTPDQPALRATVRQWTGLLNLAFLAATVPGVIANSNYSDVFDSQDKANKTATLRYVSSAVVLALIIVLYAGAWWGLRTLPQISKRGIIVLTHLTLLITTISLYRLVVMRHRTTSLTASDALNSSGQKAAFYILHVLPEWLATVVLLGYNIRKTFGTGPLGSWRWRDETQKERERKLTREAEKKAKKDMNARNILGAENGQAYDSIELEDKKQGSQLVTVTG